MIQASFLGPQYEKEIKEPKKKEITTLDQDQFCSKIQQCQQTREACVFAKGQRCLLHSKNAKDAKECNFNK